MMPMVWPLPLFWKKPWRNWERNVRFICPIVLLMDTDPISLSTNISSSSREYPWLSQWTMGWQVMKPSLMLRTWGLMWLSQTTILCLTSCPMPLPSFTQSTRQATIPSSIWLAVVWPLSWLLPSWSRFNQNCWIWLLLGPLRIWCPWPMKTASWFNMVFPCSNRVSGWVCRNWWN